MSILFKRKYIFGSLVMVILTTICLASDESEEVNKYLVQVKMLREKIEIRDAQEGFAGVSGEIWTIEPSGSWSIARFLNEEIDKPYLKGELTQEDLETLVDVFVSKNYFELSELSPQFGPGLDEKINRHLITISFGKAKLTLILKAGETITKATSEAKGPESDKIDRFKKIIQTVQGLLKEDK